jgi:hypothetical protein
MDRETLATALVVVGMVVIPVGAGLIGGLPWLILALGLESLFAGTVIGWQ